MSTIVEREATAQPGRRRPPESFEPTTITCILEEMQNLQSADFERIEANLKPAHDTAKVVGQVNEIATRSLLAVSHKFHGYCAQALVKMAFEAVNPEQAKAHERDSKRFNELSEVAAKLFWIDVKGTRQLWVEDGDLHLRQGWSLELTPTDDINTMLHALTGTISKGVRGGAFAGTLEDIKEFLANKK